MHAKRCCCPTGIGHFEFLRHDPSLLTRRIAISAKSGIGDSALRNEVLQTKARFLPQRYPGRSREHPSELQLS
jgi:hypothetical protein